MDSKANNKILFGGIISLVILIFFIWGLVLTGKIVFNKSEAGNLSDSDYNKMKFFIIMSWASLTLPLLVGSVVKK